jgi:DNA-binding MarR family transcriptional regulator
MEDEELAAQVAVGLERVVRLVRAITPSRGLSFTAAAVLSTLDRSGPCRLTVLAEREGVTQPAMTQVVSRLQEAGLVARTSDPEDGRVVLVAVTGDGRGEVARRRAAREQRLGELLAELSAGDRQALAAVLPVIDTLTKKEQESR